MSDLRIRWSKRERLTLGEMHGHECGTECNRNGLAARIRKGQPAHRGRARGARSEGFMARRNKYPTMTTRTVKARHSPDMYIDATPAEADRLASALVRAAICARAKESYGRKEPR